MSLSLFPCESRNNNIGSFLGDSSLQWQTQLSNNRRQHLVDQPTASAGIMSEEKVSSLLCPPSPPSSCPDRLLASLRRSRSAWCFDSGRSIRRKGHTRRNTRQGSHSSMHLTSISTTMLSQLQTTSGIRPTPASIKCWTWTPTRWKGLGQL